MRERRLVRPPGRIDSAAGCNITRGKTDALVIASKTKCFVS